MYTENNKSIVETALLQIKAVEDAISENAKGILASTMKEEISELVRESLVGSKKTKLREQEEQDPNLEVDVEDDVDVEDPEMSDEEEPETEPEELETEPEDGMPSFGDFNLSDEGDNQEMPPLDMTQAPIGDVLRVFRAMGDEDGIIVAKDNDDIYLKDGDNEYIIRTGAEETNTQEMMGDQMKEDVLYELVLEDEDEDVETFESYLDEEEETYENDYEEFRKSAKVDEPMFEDEDEDETVYELDVNEIESVMETFKAKGIGMCKAGNGMSKASVNLKGFKEDKKSGGRGITGKGPNFKYPSIKHGVTETDMDDEEFNEWEEESNEGIVDTETTESSRTLGKGRSHGRNGLPKPRTYSSHVRKESVESEMNQLREKNDEYKKALDFFRTKLNEVAVFNSNLAYSTRLFTEHSTTKQEKINILRRFDTVESIKESKNLYQSIKKDLDGKGTSEVVTESIQNKVTRTPQTGSSSNLIESKTYENPQFMRMKDLMTKIK